MEFREWVLRDVVRVEIRVHKPKALKQMMDSVLLIDERSIILRKRVGQSSSSVYKGGGSREFYGVGHDEG